MTNEEQPKPRVPRIWGFAAGQQTSKAVLAAMRSNTELRRTSVADTATKISTALDEMVAARPKGASLRGPLGLLVRELARKQPQLMRLIMEDADIKDAYRAVTATRKSNK